MDDRQYRNRNLLKLVEIYRNSIVFCKQQLIFYKFLSVSINFITTNLKPMTILTTYKLIIYNDLFFFSLLNSISRLWLVFLSCLKSKSWLSPRSFRMFESNRLSSFSSSVWMIYRIHRASSNLRPSA